MITLERMREVVRYDPETGDFTRVQHLGGHMVGEKAGGKCPGGYWRIGIDYRQYMAHQLAVFDQTGEWPATDVDHINGNRLDNRIVNLRVVSRTTNMQNLHKAHKDNKSKLLGVVPNHKRFSAQIRMNGKNVNLGTFDTPEQAHEAYLQAKRTKHIGCAI